MIVVDQQKILTENKEDIFKYLIHEHGQKTDMEIVEDLVDGYTEPSKKRRLYLNKENKFDICYLVGKRNKNPLVTIKEIRRIKN